MHNTILAASQTKDYNSTAIVSLEMTVQELRDLRNALIYARNAAKGHVDRTAQMFGYDSESYNQGLEAYDRLNAVTDETDAIWGYVADRDSMDEEA